MSVAPLFLNQSYPTALQTDSHATSSIFGHLLPHQANLTRHRQSGSVRSYHCSGIIVTFRGTINQNAIKASSLYQGNRRNKDLPSACPSVTFHLEYQIHIAPLVDHSVSRLNEALYNYADQIYPQGTGGGCGTRAL